MIQTMTLLPGVILRCYSVDRFKQACLNIHFVSPASAETASVNALIPAVLLRGTVKHPDMRSISLHMDDLYGAGVGMATRRVGDYQLVGFKSGFIDERYALPGDKVLEPMVAFLGELLLEPLTEDGGFNREFVRSEKRNLIAAIEAERNNKSSYATTRMIEKMCGDDPWAVPRLGTCEQVAAIDHLSAWEQYKKLLKESTVEIFYVGSVAPEQVAQLLMPIFQRMDRSPVPLPEITRFNDDSFGEHTEVMAVTQGKLAMGFVAPVTGCDEGFAAMQVFNSILGAGLTSKLFVNVREKMSLCYSIGSHYYSSKGILTVSAGIDFDKEAVTKAEILNQIKACQDGDITQEELLAAKESLLSGLRAVYDSASGIVGYETVTALCSPKLTVDAYRQAVETVTIEDVCKAAKLVRLHTTYFMKGENP